MIRSHRIHFKPLAYAVVVLLLVALFGPLVISLANASDDRGEETWFIGNVKDKETDDPIGEAKITIRKGESEYVAYTDGEGNYEKQVESGGEYSLIAERNGYGAEDAHATVETGEETRVDFQLGKKETSIFGKVRDKDTEEPINEVEITIRKGEHEFTSYTDAEGNYEKQFDEGGEFTIIAERDGYKAEDAHATVETGHEKRVDFLLEKEEEETETWFVGRVRDKETEEPIAEAEITIRKGEHEYVAYANGDGNYEKQVEGGGEYTLIAERNGYKTEDAHAAVETGDEKRVDFDLEKKEEEQETAIFGKVRDKDTGEPINEVEITIRKGEHEFTSYTNAEGNYEKQFDEGGEFAIIAGKEGYKTEDAHAAVETGQEKRVDFLLEEKEEEKQTWFVGRVRDKETEEPIVEAEITIRKGEHEYVTYTNGDGNYEKQVEGGGEYTLIAERNGYKTEDAHATVETGEEKRVDFLLEEKEEEKETWFVGTVRDKETEEPIREAKITIRKGEHEYVSYTNDDGHYEKQVEGGGEYTLIAERNGYKAEDAHATVETGDEKRVNFLLEKKEEKKEAWFFGKVRDKDTEEPIVEAKITIKKGEHEYVAYTNQDGNYEKRVEGSEEYTLIVEKSGYKTEDARATVETGHEKQVDFLLEEEGGRGIQGVGADSGDPDTIYLQVLVVVLVGLLAFMMLVISLPTKYFKR